MNATEQDSQHSLEDGEMRELRGIGQASDIGKYLQSQDRTENHSLE
jgi:hypothetical protein